MAGPVMSLGLLGKVWHVASTHGEWMAWNLVLALVPLVLAGALFRAGVRRGALWWAGATAFVVFLPNAPYVLTDVIHLFDDIRTTGENLDVLMVHVPIYLVFFAAGFGSYVATIELTRRYVRTEAPQLRWLVVEIALHVVCAAGIYLGRVMRLNSWEILTRPRAFVAGVSWLAGIAPVALVVLTAAALAVLTLVARVLAWSAADAAIKVRLRLRPAS